MPSFGRYTLLRPVGRGGMAQIWKGVASGAQGFRKTLAIKMLLPELVEDRDFMAMFAEETKLVADLHHPNIVQVFDFGRAGEKDYFIAMEYVSGTNLASLLSRSMANKRALPAETAVYLGIEALKALGYAHARVDGKGNSLGIVHRDVSPHNILISFDGEVKLSDFGIAKVASALPRTAAGLVRGKLAYMSPEQAALKPGGPLDGRSDLFSLALCLHEMLTSRRLFRAESSSDLYQLVAGYKGLAGHELAGVPEPLKPVLSMALDPEPAARYRNAASMERALSVALGPEAPLMGRQALSRVVQELFGEEMTIDRTPEPVPEQEPSHPGMEGGVLPAIQTAEWVRNPSQDTTVPTGLTLASGVGPKVESISQRPTVVVGERRKTWLFAVLTTGVVAAVMALALWLFGPSRPPTAGGPAGSLSVSARPWAEVWIDDRRVALTTPLKAYRLPAGRHLLRLVNEPAGASLERSIDVPPDGQLIVAADMESKEIRVGQ